MYGHRPMRMIREYLECVEVVLNNIRLISLHAFPITPFHTYIYISPQAGFAYYRD